MATRIPNPLAESMGTPPASALSVAASPSWAVRQLWALMGVEAWSVADLEGCLLP